MWPPTQLRDLPRFVFNMFEIHGTRPAKCLSSWIHYETKTLSVCWLGSVGKGGGGQGHCCSLSGQVDHPMLCTTTLIVVSSNFAWFHFGFSSSSASTEVAYIISPLALPPDSLFPPLCVLLQILTPKRAQPLSRANVPSRCLA